MKIKELIKDLDAYADEITENIDITDIVTHTD